MVWSLFKRGRKEGVATKIKGVGYYFILFRHSEFFFFCGGEGLVTRVCVGYQHDHTEDPSPPHPHGILFIYLFIFRLFSNSNINIAGQYLFHLGDTHGANIGQPDPNDCKFIFFNKAQEPLLLSHVFFF